MKKIKLILPQTLLAFGLLALTTACDKEEESFTQISGVVYDKNSNPRLPVANAQVFFEYRKPWTFGAEIFHIDSTRTDANGRYSIAAETPNENLHIYATSPNHYSGGDLGMRPNVQRGKNQTMNLAIIPHAWVRMNIRRTGQFDWMGVNRLVGGEKSFQIYSDTVLVSRAWGNEEVNISVFKFNNNTQNNFSYYVSTIGRDTVDISIDF
jgi:hypothetical protein